MNVVVAPQKRSRRSGDGDAALSLLWHPIQLSLAFVDFADLVDTARVVQEPLADRGLASVDVGDNADVANPVELLFAAALGLGATGGGSGGWGSRTGSSYRRI